MKTRNHRYGHWLRHGHYYYEPNNSPELALGLPARIKVFWFSTTRNGKRRPGGRPWLMSRWVSPAEFERLA
jgi:hypothetical protein